MKTYLILLLALIVISCSSKVEEDFVNDKLLSLKTESTPLALSDLVDSVQFVPFENGRQCMLSYAKKTLVRKGLVYVLDQQPLPTIKVFDLNGKYIRNIGRIGHGRGEYVDIDDFTINELGDSVFILCNNMVNVYSQEGAFLFTKDIDMKGVIRRLEACCGGYVCLTEYKGNDFLLHFMDYGFDVRKDLISSDGIIIKEPSEVLYPIQIYGKYVWYYNYFNSTFYVVDTQDSYEVSKYHLSSDRAYKIEQFEKYIFTNNYDAVSAFQVGDGMITGIFHKANHGDMVFRWSLNSDVISLSPMDGWIPYYMVADGKRHYSVLEQDVFIRLNKQMHILDKISNNYAEVSKMVTEKNNFILVGFNFQK